MTRLVLLWKIVHCGLTITTHLGGTTLSKDFSSSPWSSASSVRHPILSCEWFLINMRNNHQISDGQLCDKTDTFLTAFLPCMTIVIKDYTTRVRRCKKELDIIRKWNSTWAAGTSSALCICQQGPTVFLATFRLPAKNEIWQDVYKYIWGIAWFCWGGRNQGKLSLADLNCLKEASQEVGWEQ